jgi:hypothetical protein
MEGLALLRLRPTTRWKACRRSVCWGQRRREKQVAVPGSRRRLSARQHLLSEVGGRCEAGPAHGLANLLHRASDRASDHQKPTSPLAGPTTRREECQTTKEGKDATRSAPRHAISRSAIHARSPSRLDHKGGGRVMAEVPGLQGLRRGGLQQALKALIDDARMRVLRRLGTEKKQAVAYGLQRRGHRSLGQTEGRFLPWQRASW